MSFVPPVLRTRHPHRFLLRARNHFTTTATAAGLIAALATGLPSPFAAHVLVIGSMQGRRDGQRPHAAKPKPKPKGPSLPHTSHGSDSAPASPPSPWKLFVHNLPYTAPKQDILDLFSAKEVQFLMHPETGKYNGSAFVFFESKAAMEEGLQHEGETLGQRTIHCALPTASKRSAAPGGGGGKRNLPYSPYLDIGAVREGIKFNTLVVGLLHCTKYGHSVAFVRNPLFVGGDVVVDGLIERNRALPGDVVVVRLHPKAQWKKRTAQAESPMAYPTPPRPDGANRTTRVDSVAAARLIRQVLGSQVDPLAYTLPPVFDPDEQPTGEVVHILERKPPLEQKTVICRFIPGDQTGAKAKAPAVQTAHAEEEEVTDVEEPFVPEEDLETGEVFVYKAVALSGDHVAESSTKAPPPPVATPVVAVDDPAYHRAPPKPELPPPTGGRLLRFRPDDETHPIVLVPEAEIAPHVDPQHRPDYLYFFRLVEWDERSMCPTGTFVEFIGKVGTIEAESRALLRAHEVCTDDFSEEIYKEVTQPFAIPDAEGLRRQHRRDLRKEEFACTIDPATARDLDDALSCEQLPDGTFRVGVHIADVSHFVRPETAVDAEAGQRCTTVYLIQEAIPMLPRILCEEHCSLNANMDKFAFSVIWRMKADGEIISEWFGKSVIHNYCRMSYAQAQAILDDTITDDELDLGAATSAEDRPALCAKVRRSVNNLNALALVLRNKRFLCGSLRLQRNRIGFVFPKLKGEDGEDLKNEDTRFTPQDIFVYKSQQSNHLVEEFMLLANMQVAEKMVTWLPVQSLVRRHVGPTAKKLESAHGALEELGISVDVGSGPALAKSLEKLGTGRKADIVKLIMTYCMQLAKYCSSDDSEGIGLHHFALNVPLYTHFTSPIRRYPDVIVHRTLDFILELERLGESPPPPEILPVSVAFAKDTLAKLRGMSATALVARIEESEEARMGRPDFLYTPEELEEICIRCNTKKWNAKKASDASNLVFFSYYLKTLLVRTPDKPYLEGQAYVVSMDCKKKVFNIFVPEYALDHAVTPADVEVQPWESLTFSPDKTTIHWKVGGTTTVKILTTFEVRIQYALHVGRMSFDVICLREARLADPFPNDPADQS